MGRVQGDGDHPGRAGVPAAGPWRLPAGGETELMTTMSWTDLPPSLKAERHGAMGYAAPFTYRITNRESGGRHGEGSDAQQQRKEEAEAGQEQEERRRSALTVRRHAQPGQARHLVHEPIRQEALAGVASPRFRTRHRSGSS